MAPTNVCHLTKKRKVLKIILLPYINQSTLSFPRDNDGSFIQNQDDFVDFIFLNSFWFIYEAFISMVKF